MTNEKYDSRESVLKHISRVRELLGYAANELLRRGKIHDDSKLREPEKSIFDVYSPKLLESKFGSDEYLRFLSEMRPALEHHYANNSHHPEHYKNGISGMNLFDLMEMFFDWKAASERHQDRGDILESIEFCSKKYQIPMQLKDILENTAKKMETEQWLRR